MAASEDVGGGILSHGLRRGSVRIVFLREILRAVEHHHRTTPPACLWGVSLVLEAEALALRAYCWPHIVIPCALETEACV